VTYTSPETLKRPMRVVIVAALRRGMRLSPQECKSTRKKKKTAEQRERERDCGGMLGGKTDTTECGQRLKWILRGRIGKIKFLDSGGERLCSKTAVDRTRGRTDPWLTRKWGIGDKTAARRKTQRIQKNYIGGSQRQPPMSVFEKLF